MRWRAFGRRFVIPKVYSLFIVRHKSCFLAKYFGPFLPWLILFLKSHTFHTVISNLWITAAAQRRDDFLLRIEVRYCCCTFCHLGLHLPSTKLVHPNPSFCSFTAAQIPKSVEYLVCAIVCLFLQRNIISSIVDDSFGSVCISSRIGFKIFLTAFLKFFFLFYGQDIIVHGWLFLLHVRSTGIWRSFVTACT